MQQSFAGFVCEIKELTRKNKNMHVSTWFKKKIKGRGTLTFRRKDILKLRKCLKGKANFWLKLSSANKYFIIQKYTMRVCSSRTSNSLTTFGASQVVLVVKKLSANGGDVRDTQVQSLGWQDPLK